MPAKARSRTGHPARPAADRSPVSDPVVCLKIEFEIDRAVWVSGFTRRHTDLQVEAHNVMVLPENQILGEFDIYGQPHDWTREIAGLPDVNEVERLVQADTYGRYRVRFQMSPMLTLEQALEIIVRYPASSRNGISTVELVGRLSRFRHLMSSLLASGRDPKVVSLAPDRYRPSELALTPVQLSLFRQALALGYFDVPRRITLTELATKVSRSKSSVSHTLAVVERSLAEFAQRTIS
jgi:HTH DNA binding domain